MYEKVSRVRRATVAVLAVVICASCGGSNTDASTNEKSAGPLVVGSQAYYSNEIVAEIYSQALEAGGFEVKREFQIGQREVYLPEISNGKIDVFPEYIGSLLQALDPAAKSGTTETVYASLQKVTPTGLTVLSPSAASDQNSWTVTETLAEKFNLTDIASLAKVAGPLKVGGNSELETRPYGPQALADLYGIRTTGFTAVEDSGGPLTVKALVSGDIQLANVYTADPNVLTNKLVTLADPDGLFFPDNIAPVVSTRVDASARAILNRVSKNLSQTDLRTLNAESVNEKKSSAVIAKDWLTKHPIVG
jgi:osmoprotectant transport system substrate-binding protein